MLRDKDTDIRIFFAPVESATHKGILHLYVSKESYDKIKATVQIASITNPHVQNYEFKKIDFDVPHISGEARLLYGKAKLAEILQDLEEGKNVFNFPTNPNIKATRHVQQLDIQQDSRDIPNVQLQGGLIEVDRMQKASETARQLKEIIEVFENKDISQQINELEDLIREKLSQAKRRPEDPKQAKAFDRLKKIFGHTIDTIEKTHTNTVPERETLVSVGSDADSSSNPAEMIIENQIKLRAELFSLLDKYTPEQIKEILPNINIPKLEEKYGKALVEEFINKLNKHAEESNK